MDPAIDSDLVTFIHRRVLIAPALYLASIAVSLVSQVAALAVIVAVPVIYIFPNPLDHYHHRQLTMAADKAPDLDDE